MKDFRKNIPDVILLLVVEPVSALLSPDDGLWVRDLGQRGHDAAAGHLHSRNILGDVVGPRIQISSIIILAFVKKEFALWHQLADF